MALGNTHFDHGRISHFDNDWIAHLNNGGIYNFDNDGIAHSWNNGISHFNNCWITHFDNSRLLFWEMVSDGIFSVTTYEYKVHLFSFSELFETILNLSLNIIVTNILYYVINI